MSTWISTPGLKGLETVLSVDWCATVMKRGAEWEYSAGRRGGTTQGGWAKSKAKAKQRCEAILSSMRADWYPK